MRRLLPVLALLLMGATCERRAEERLVVASEQEASATSTAAVEVERESRETRGPVEVTTTTEEYYPCDPLSCPDAAAPDAQRQTIKRRVVRVERREPVVREVRQEARAEGQATAETHAVVKAEQTAKVETQRTAGPPWFVWVMGACAVLAAGYLAIKRGLP